MSGPSTNTSGTKTADDLFDLPVEASGLPSLDEVDAATTLAAFEIAQPEPENPQPAHDARPKPAPAAPKRVAPSARLRRVWIAFGALALANVLVLGLVWSKSALPAHETHDPALSAAAEAAPVAVAEPAPVHASAVPAAAAGGRARLQAVEAAIDAGRRAFARVELGRILLDADSLPAAEREDTRAQAELLLARILQDTADEARRTSR